MKIHITMMASFLLWPTYCTFANAHDKLVDGVYISNTKYEGLNRKDCLVVITVEKIPYVYFNSDQANGYSCNIEGKLIIKNGKYFWPDWYANNNFDGVYFLPKNLSDSIVIKSVSNKSSKSMQYCGIHASLDTVKLQLKSKLQTIDNNDENEDVLAKYCK